MIFQAMYDFFQGLTIFLAGSGMLEPEHIHRRCFQLNGKLVTIGNNIQGSLTMNMSFMMAMAFFGSGN